MIWLALPILLLLAQVRELPPEATNPHTTQADLALGRKLFLARCGGCHGPSGDGGKGANLALPVLPRATNDRALYSVIRYGLVDTEMPASNMTPLEIWQVAGFVKTLGQAAENLPGNPTRGQQLVRGKGGCLQCHALGLDGGRLGPSLNEVGSRRGPAYFRQKLLAPAENVPEEFRMVIITTKSGERVTGLRLNEDTWSIQLRDMKGVPRSFWKEELTELKEVRRTPMPAYRNQLTPGELDDVTAFLASLKGNP